MIPEPDRFAAELARVVSTAGRMYVADHYRWLYGWVLSAPSGDGVKVAGGGHGDPSFRAVDVHAVGRRELERVADHVRKAAEELGKAEHGLRRVLVSGPRDGMAEDLAGAGLSRAELRRVRGAKGRRLARGEGWGEA